MRRSSLLRCVAQTAGVLAMLCCFGTAVQADDAVTLNNQPVLPGETAEQCYSDATDQLKHGVWYERAAIQLKEAIRQDPKNVDYHLALGCAYADRAASLGHAAEFARVHQGDLAQYQKSLDDWNKAQSDPANSLYHTDKPLMPPGFVAYTKDDLRIFALTPDQTKAVLVELAKKAEGEWKQAVALSKDRQARAYAEYVESWGIYLLSQYRFGAEEMDDFYGPAFDQQKAPTLIKGMPGPDEAVDCFRDAIKDDPAQAISWESLGYAIGAPGTGMADSLNEHSDDPDKYTNSMPAYRHALKLNPKNALLWWYIAQYETSDAPDKAASDLRQSIAADPTNAYPMYVLGLSDLKQTRYINNYIENSDVDHKDFAATENVDKAMAATLTDQDRQLASDAIRLVEEGNEAPFCHYPVYHPPIPPMLLPAFDYKYGILFLFPAFAQQRALARDLCGYADVAALTGDLTTAFDVDREIIAMGKRTVGDWAMEDNWKTGDTTIEKLVGMAIVNIGYANMLRIAQHYGDANMARAVQAESDAFKDQVADWKHALQESNFIERSIYTNY